MICKNGLNIILNEKNPKNKMSTCNEILITKETTIED